MRTVNLYLIFIVAIILGNCNNRSQDSNRPAKEATNTKDRIIDYINVSNSFIPDLDTKTKKNVYVYENDYIENINIDSLEDVHYRQKFFNFLDKRDFEQGQYEQVYFIQLLLTGVQQTNDKRFYYLLTEAYKDDILGSFLDDYSLYLYQLVLYKPDYFIKNSYQYKDTQFLDYINRTLPPNLLIDKRALEDSAAKIDLKNNMLLINERVVKNFDLDTLKKDIINNCPSIKAIFPHSDAAEKKNQTVTYYDIFNYLNNKITKNLNKDELDFYNQRYFLLFNNYIIKDTNKTH